MSHSKHCEYKKYNPKAKNHQWKELITVVQTLLLRWGGDLFFLGKTCPKKEGKWGLLQKWSPNERRKVGCGWCVFACYVGNRWSVSTSDFCAVAWRPGFLCLGRPFCLFIISAPGAVSCGPFLTPKFWISVPELKHFVLSLQTQWQLQRCSSLGVLRVVSSGTCWPVSFLDGSKTWDLRIILMYTLAFLGNDFC